MLHLQNSNPSSRAGAAVLSRPSKCDHTLFKEGRLPLALTSQHSKWLGISYTQPSARRACLSLLSPVSGSCELASLDLFCPALSALSICLSRLCSCQPTAFLSRISKFDALGS